VPSIFEGFDLCLGLFAGGAFEEYVVGRLAVERRIKVDEIDALIIDGVLQDGEVVAQSGLEITTSQRCQFEADTDYNVFVQLSDGSVESIECTPGSTDYSLVLANAPRLPLSLASDAYAKANYYLVADTDAKVKTFLVNEVSPQEGKTAKVNCSNYDAGFYQNDTDYINELITE